MLRLLYAHIPIFFQMSPSSCLVHLKGPNQGRRGLHRMPSIARRILVHIHREALRKRMRVMRYVSIQCEQLDSRLINLLQQRRAEYLLGQVEGSHSSAVSRAVPGARVAGRKIQGSAPATTSGNPASSKPSAGKPINLRVCFFPSFFCPLIFIDTTISFSDR